jgi:uncharacterized tellurite resistance protein B-like protein
MFGSLKTFISGLIQETTQANYHDKAHRLATAALLVRVATIDSDMSAARLGKLYAVLKSHFVLDELVTAQLIKDAVAINRNAIDLYHFTSQLKDATDEEGRRRIVKMMWEIVLVEGRANEFENNIIWRAADLLGVSSRQRIELRQCVAANIALPRCLASSP